MAYAITMDMLPETLQPQRKGHSAGFTLLEVLVSLTMMLILLSNLSSFGFHALSDRWKGREAASLALRILKRAKWLAISENAEYGVIFGMSVPTGLWQAQLVKKDPHAWAPIGPPEAFPTVVREVKTSGPSLKQFNPDGTSVSGSVILSCASGRTYRLTLTPATGRIRLYRE